MALSTRSLILLISLPVTVCAAILYYLHKKDDDWDELEILTNKNRLVEVKVPSEKVASVIGRGGNNIKKLQDQTNTKINFCDKIKKSEDGEHQVCKIRGTPENVEKAEKLLIDLIYNQPEILSTEIWVPQSSCGRLIGRCGENIKAISSQSNAHIIVDSFSHSKATPKDHKASANEKQVIIKGTAQEIAVAMSLIKKVVEDERQMRSTLNSRPPRVQPSANLAKQKADQQVGVVNNESVVEPPPPPPPPAPVAEQLTSPAGDEATTDGMIQIYVSSVAHPHAFWVQLVSPRSVELDHLVEDMTEYYSKEENKELHKLESGKPGQIVAAPFETDNRWYRVEVCGIVEDKKSEDDSPILDIFYVDYGDSGYLSLNQVLELRTDFLSLRFQAIECRLANIEMNEGETEWSEEVISEFEQLVYSAQWKRIMVRICGYHQKEGDSPPIPVVKLFDPTLGVDVAEELIKKGLARAPPSDKPSVSLVKPTIVVESKPQPQ